LSGKPGISNSGPWLRIPGHHLTQPVPGALSIALLTICYFE
jgi:hypothetical protein